MTYFIPVWGDEKEYEVNQLGQIRNKKTGRILKGHTNGQGYVSVGLTKDGKFSRCLVHRIVAMTFLKEYVINGRTSVNHKDSNPSNNNIDNLEWCTAAENTAHSFLHGNNSHKSYNTYKSKLGLDLEQEYHDKIKEGAILGTNGNKTQFVRDAIEHYYKLVKRRSQGKED